MNSLSKLAVITSGILTASVLAFSLAPVFADSPGQLGSGSEVYQAKNLSQNGGYATTISAGACNEVQYSVELHNAAFGAFSNVHVSISLPNSGGASNVTATTNLGGTSGTTGSTTVNLASGQTISMESGSGVEYDVNGNTIKSLSDTLVNGNGVDIGAMNGSTTVFVDFKAKVSCPPTQSYSATKTVTIPVSQTVNVSVNCPKGDTTSTQSASATASSSVTGSGSATSTVSQADADAKAQAAAQADANSKVAAATQAAKDKANADATAAANAKCTPTTTTTVTTSTPTSLPNTGPGDELAALFGGTSALGAAGHYIVRRVRR